MNIKIKYLELTNFKCFRHKEFYFDSDITTFKGRNGVGKTTIADAILFCLFGKNTAGQSDLELFKTRENGKVVPNIDHSVEMTLEIDPVVTNINVKTVTLKRSIKEVWIKKRGSEELVFKNNTCEYFVNGESYTQADYKKYIDSIISEDLFRAITNPQYFLSLKWQIQREFLAKMVGDIEPEAIANTDELVTLCHALDDSNDDIISYRKHLSYQIKQIKDKLDKIPVRLEEQNKALPECLDWDALQIELAQAQHELKDVDKKYIAIKSGNADEVKRAEIRQQLQEHSSSLSAIESRTRTFIAFKENQKNQAVALATRKFNALVTTQRDLEAAIPSFDTLISRCRETLAKCEQDAEKIRLSWAENNARKVEWSDDDNICPTCGQYLPAELIAERRQKAIADLNAKKALRKQALTEEADRVKAIREGANKEIELNEQRKAEKEKALADVKEQINQVFAQKAKLEKEPLPTYADLLAKDEEYQALLAKGKALNDAMNTTFTGDEDAIKQQLDELVQRKNVLSEGISTLNTQLATRLQYDKVLALIDSINAEQKDLVKQLSELEKKEDIACQYQDRQNAILEERVNQHFTLVRWKMFRTINNGGDPVQEPYCECLVGGIPYGGGLNQAARLNAGLDVLNSLCKHYNVSAPVLIDNAESVNNILQTIGQQVRLYVSEDEDLTTV